MGKYEPLARYLESREDNSWNATFAQIEERLGFPLPRSASEHRAWWSNQRNSNHSQTAGWQKAGWETREVDLRRGLVRFERANKSVAGQPKFDLWRQAMAMSGINDRDQLIETALTALIQREASRTLIGMGGTAPEAVSAPRERPFK
ncbi:MAG: hypothetical protein ABJA20_11180 [Novosphingobium sp.]